jgi:cell wall-associated NlpC family hydrolase
MRSVSAASVAVAILLAFAATASATVTSGGAAAVNGAKCDFTAAVGKCAAIPAQTRCGQWRCLAATCPSDVTFAQAISKCGTADANAPLYPAKTAPMYADGTDLLSAPPPKKSSDVKAATPLLGDTPRVESSCLHVSAKWDVENIRALLYSFSMDIFAGRFNETYTEDMNKRWDGINNGVCAPAVPRYSDCSSTVTWIYWNLFGNGNDFMNGENWTAGYTGTLVAHGTQVSADESSLKVGDLCFYYHPMHHVAIYVGGGMVVSHGMDPVGYYAWNYAPVDSCRRYI